MTSAFLFLLNVNIHECVCRMFVLQKLKIILKESRITVIKT